MAYRTDGEGPLDLVFSVGLSNCEVLWDHPTSARFLERLASFSRLVVFDFRGSGASDGLQSAGFPTWEDWTGDVLAVLDDLGSQRCAFFLSGTAAPSGIIFAATYPERTVAFALYQASPQRGDPAVVEAVKEYIATGWGTIPFAQGLAASMVDDERYIEWVAKAQRLAATPRLAAALIGQYQLFDASDLLGLVQAPTLILHSASPFTQDPWESASRMADARVVELETADDLLFGTEGSDVVVDHLEEFITGVRPAQRHDRVLATVLFTDIVGSTQRVSELGDSKWRRVLDLHDECVREHIARARGNLVKTTGDGILATFDGPARAVECAKDLRKGLAARGIDIRAGLHTGEVEVRGGDVGGIAVHIGARVSSIAGPGEIFVSSTVKDLVVGSDLRFDERGTHTLEGVPGEWRLFSVAG